MTDIIGLWPRFLSLLLLIEWLHTLSGAATDRETGTGTGTGTGAGTTIDIGTCAKNSYGLVCSLNGYFEAEQCVGTEETTECWCVNKFSGREIMNTRTNRTMSLRKCEYPEDVISVYLQIRSNIVFQQIYKRVNASETQRVFQRFTEAFTKHLQLVSGDNLDGVAFSYSLLAMTGYGKSDSRNQSSRPSTFEVEKPRHKQTEMKLQLSIIGYGESVSEDWLVEYCNNLISKGESLPLLMPKHDDLLVRRVRVVENNGTSRLSPGRFQELPLANSAPLNNRDRDRSTVRDAYSSPTPFPARISSTSCESRDSSDSADCADADSEMYTSETAERRRRNQLDSEDSGTKEQFEKSFNEQSVAIGDLLGLMEHPAFKAVAICIVVLVSTLAILGSLYCARNHARCIYSLKHNSRALNGNDCVGGGHMWCRIRSQNDYYGAPAKVDREFFA